MKRLLIYLLSLLLLLFVFELVLRKHYGFCDAPLSQTSDKYEYVFQANQNRYRFKNHINYNEVNMRSDSLDVNSIKILGLGDSVINGGAFTDQDSIATTILSNELSSELSRKVQILNISAGSWGPDNCNAFLEEKGAFDSKLMLLVASSHDAHDIMDFRSIVGISSAFPNKQYKFAICELFDRYIYPRYIAKYFKTSQEDFNQREGIKKNGIGFNSGFKKLAQKANKLNIPMIIYLHAEQSELKNNAYNEQGEEIIQFANKNKIKIIKELENGLDKSWYHDEIHLNNKGQRMMSKILKPYIENVLNN